MDGFEKELESLLNKYSQENGSNTPDFILAKYLNDCLTVWNHSIAAREKWYGREKAFPRHGQPGHQCNVDPNEPEPIL